MYFIYRKLEYGFLNVTYLWNTSEKFLISRTISDYFITKHVWQCNYHYFMLLCFIHGISFMLFPFLWSSCILMSKSQEFLSFYYSSLRQGTMGTKESGQKKKTFKIWQICLFSLWLHSGRYVTIYLHPVTDITLFLVSFHLVIQFGFCIWQGIINETGYGHELMSDGYPWIRKEGRKKFQIHIGIWKVPWRVLIW